MSSSGIFKKICEDFGLRHKVVDVSPYIIEDVNHDNKTLYSMIEDAFDKTLAYAKKRYMARDNYGTLEHVDVESLRTGLVIGDMSLLANYSYETSIDKDVYNKVKLIQENKGSGKRDAYIVFDSKNMSKWGALQYHEKVDENANEARIAEKAENLLKLHNSVRRKLTLECLGDFRVSAGAGVMLAVKELGDISLNQYCVVNSCRHNIKNNMHMMTIGVDIWLANS
jgi:hypothetical protein